MKGGVAARVTLKWGAEGRRGGGTKGRRGEEAKGRRGEGAKMGDLQGVGFLV